MVKTGIRKYDLLPAVLGGDDIDYIRWRYSLHINNMFIRNIFLKKLNRFIFSLSKTEFVLLKRRLDFIVEGLK
jgi:hypothetical protein